MRRAASDIDPTTRADREPAMQTSIERALALVRPLHTLLTRLRERAQTVDRRTI